MFCPNCGTQNDSAATPCKKCGFRLSGVSTSKFKGTMMLNSDQTVQELIEEHKKKKAEAGMDAEGKPVGSSPPGAYPGSTPPRPASWAPPASGPPGTPRPVFQPPRAGAPKRRMGGTMLGVAPQVGGVAPPTGDTTAAPPAAQLVHPSVDERPSTFSGMAPLEPSPAPTEPPLGADPLAGTVAMPVIEAAAPASVPAGHEPRATAPDISDAAHGVTAGRAPAVTAPLQQYPSSEPPPALVDPEGPPARRIRPFEIALIVLTCGLYGIVVLLRQRKPSAPEL